MHIGKNALHVGKKEVATLKAQPLLSKNLMFAHKATLGQTVIDLTNLSTPSEMLANGFVQASTSDILAARLGSTRARLKLVSSLRGALIDYFDYNLPSSSTIVMSDELEENEVIVGRFESNSDLIPVSGERVVKTYTLGIGQTTLNLGQEYKVGRFIDQNVGAITVFAGGFQVYRNTLNSDTNLDKQYYEVDSGNGYGTLLEFNVPPISFPIEVTVDFGYRSISDSNALGTLESLQGSMIKIATDLANLGGTSLSDYLSANPSEIERRTFGDQVLANTKKLELYNTTQTLSEYTKTKWQYKGPITTTSIGTISGLTMNNLTIGKTYRATCNVRFTCGGGAQMAVRVWNGGNFFPQVQTTEQNGASPGQDSASSCAVLIFIATAPDVTVQVTGVVSAGNSITAGLLLEELSNHIQTSEWT